MKKQTLQKRLLMAFVAISFSAIILCVGCFGWMINRISDEAVKRGRMATSTLIDFVLHGFLQTELNSFYYLLSHVQLALEDQKFADDEEKCDAAVQEFVSVARDAGFESLELFLTRDGHVTAARLVENNEAISSLDANAVERALQEFFMENEWVEGTTIDELLNPDGDWYAGYLEEKEGMPMYRILPLGDGEAVGIFIPQAASRHLYTALNEASHSAHNDSENIIISMEGDYMLILIGVALVLLTTIGLIAWRLSQSIAEPVEREKEMLERINKLKTEFLANVSHELKTPLTVMSGYAQHGQKVLRDIPQAKEVERSMKVIVSEADRMALMVSQVLDISQIEEDRMFLHLQENEVMQIIQEAMDTYYPTFSKNNNVLRVEPAALPPVKCDTGRVIQVLVNLVSNASRHTRDGEICIRAQQKDNLVAITVEDTGEGMSEEEMATMFERYRTKKGPGSTGTGLGLYISKHIVQAQGGTILVTSEKGKGTSVSFTLPTAGEEAQC